MWHILEKKNAQMILERKHEGKRLPGSPSSTGEDNIKRDLKEIG
jgi:hypothetical protein